MRLTIILLCIARVAAANPVLAERPTQLLDGALELRLPAGMTRVPNERDLDGRALPTWVTGRAELTLGNGALYVVARFTFMRADGDLKKSVNTELALQDLVAVVKTTTFGGAPGATVDPPSPRRGDASDLIHAAYVVSDNKLIASVSFYASGSAYDDIATYVELARASTATLRTFGDWEHWGVTSAKLGDVTLALDTPLGWTLVAVNGPVMAYQGGALGKPAAVCGIDDDWSRAPANSNAEAMRFLGVGSTARSWLDGRLGRAEVIAKKIRAWCRVRGGRPADAVRALRMLLAGVKP